MSLPLAVAALSLALLAQRTACAPAAAADDTFALTNATHVDLLDHGSTVCFQPAPQTQILAFFLTNYIARIATFKKTSGYEGWRDWGKTIVSLFVPFLGISQAAHTIARGSRFLGHNELNRALHAQALCVIVRGEGWRPEDGEIVRGCRLEAGRSRRRRRRARPRRAASAGRREASAGRREKSRESRDDAAGRGYRRLEGPRYSHDSVQSTEALSRDHSSDADSDSSDDEYVLDATLLVERIRNVEPLVNPKKWKIQGYYSLPESYTMATLTPAAVLQPLSTSNARTDQIVLSNSYGIAKSFAGVIQIVSSVYSLYSAYGSQVKQYGYATFSFSVLPYTIMSVLNAIANMVEADYDSLFLVRSDVMAEAEKREGGEFIGEVAELKPLPDDIEKVRLPDTVDLLFHREPDTGRWKAFEVDAAGRRMGTRTWRLRIPTLDAYSASRDRRQKLYIPAVGRLYQADLVRDRRAKKFHDRGVFVLITLSLALPYAIIGLLSHFEARNSTVQQRTLMMGWLIVGQIIGVMELGVSTSDIEHHHWWIYLERAVETLIVVLGFAFAVGGFVVTARMFREFGYCVRL